MAAGSKKTITIKLKGSLIGSNPRQRAVMKGLGLKRIQQTKTLENTPAVRGMIKKVIHLVDVVSEE